MTKIQMTAPRPRRIDGISNIEGAIIAYFASRPNVAITYATVELHLTSKGIKRPQRARVACSELAFKGYLKPLPFGAYQFRCAA